MFSFRNFVFRGFLDAVGKQPDYWIILNASGYANQGVLLIDDLAAIQSALDIHNASVSKADDPNHTEPVSVDESLDTADELPLESAQE